MAEKILNTRVVLKYDTLANWNASSLILKAGELAIVQIPTNTSGSGLTPPAYGIKVGDGNSTFATLPWIQAIAGDVQAWAKAATKPTYQANEIIGLEEFITNGIEDNNTIYQIVAGTGANDKKWFLQKQEQGTASWTTVSTIDLTNLQEDIVFNTAYNATTNKAASMTDVTNAINALDVSNITGLGAGKTLATLTETDGKIAATFQDIDITATQISDAGTIITKNAATAISNTSTDQEVPTADVIYSFVEGKIAGLEGAMHFIGVATVAITEGSITDPVINGYDFSKKAQGDVVLYNGKEFVWGPNSWHEFGHSGSFVLNTVTVTGHNGLTGGGTLDDNIEIHHATAPTATASGVTGHGNASAASPSANDQYLTGIGIDTYGHVAEVKMATLPTYTLTQDGTDGHKISWKAGTAPSTVITIPDNNTEYTFTEGSVNGEFTVTPSSGAAQQVKVHGLSNLAFSSNVNDLEQTTGDVLVLNCGSSTLVI